MYRPLDEKSPPVGGFSLSVASYVVKARTGKFKRKKKYKNSRKTRPFPQKELVFVELLSEFEPEVSSLPTDWKPGNCWCSVVSGPFCSGKMRISVLSAPLLPSTTFPVWVRLWVKRFSGSK